MGTLDAETNLLKIGTNLKIFRNGYSMRKPEEK
jgi:hypothetical protein